MIKLEKFFVKLYARFFGETEVVKYLSGKRK